MRPSTCAPRLAFDDHRVDPGLRQELPEQQARRAGADDRDLCPRDLRPRGHAASMPWRRFASIAAGDAMNASSARASSGCRARAPTAAEKVVTIWISGGNGPSTSMPAT